jgi:general secretion pathway protein L
MQEKLVINIHAQAAEHPSWAVIDADGKVRQFALHDSANGLSQVAIDKEVIVLVPAEDVLLTSTRLPKMNRARLQQALPYALEEQLIGDIETLHFAVGDYQPDTLFGVAIVAHEKMQQWLSLLQTWQIKPNIMMPLTFALPYADNAWHILVSQEIAVFRMAAMQGMACETNNFSAVMDLALASTLSRPEHIVIHNYSSQAMSEGVKEPLQWQETMLSADAFIEDVARSALSTPYINLLQGNYAVKKTRLPQWDNAGKKVVNLAKIVLLLLFLYPLGSLLILNSRVSTIDDNIAAIYKYHFPQASSVVAPKVRMQDKLNKLESKIADNKLLLLLGYVGKGMQATPSIKLKRLDFQNNQLTLMLMAASSEDFSSFTEFLTGKGLKVKQQNATILGERINATLQVE